jgi:hypothetical protein
MVKEVRSPWNSTRDMPNAQRGISPGAYSSPSNSRQRADGGHLVRSPGKGGSGKREARQHAGRWR